MTHFPIHTYVVYPRANGDRLSQLCNATTSIRPCGDVPDTAMKIRHTTSAGDDKIELHMTPMIDIVFQLLIFFVMTFKIVTPEGDFNISMPEVSPSETDEPEENPKIIIKLEADANGNLVNINYNDQRNFGDQWTSLQAELVRFVGPDSGPSSSRAKTEVEIDAPANLQYRHIVHGLNYITGQIVDGQVVKLIENVKFKPPKPPGAPS